MDILSHRCCVCVDTKRDHGGQENTSRLCGIWGKIWRALGNKDTKRDLVDKRTIHVYVEFEAKFGELWAPRKIQKSHFSRKKVCACWRFESWLGVCSGSIYHVHFAWQVWHGQLSPRFKFNKLKSFSGVEIDQNHVDKRILGGKGFAVGRLKRHNFCPASVVMLTVCDIWKCSTSLFDLAFRAKAWPWVVYRGVWRTVEILLPQTCISWKCACFR